MISAKTQKSLCRRSHLAKMGIIDSAATLSGNAKTCRAPADEQCEDRGRKVSQSPKLGCLALLRKFHSEAITLLVASINEQVKSDTSDPNILAKRFSSAEEQSSLEVQAKGPADLEIAGELTLSHQLLGVTNAMVESGVPIWNAPSNCSKRDEEIHANTQPAASTLQIEQSTLKVAQVPVATTANVGSESQLQGALQRLLL